MNQNTLMLKFLSLWTLLILSATLTAQNTSDEWMKQLSSKTYLRTLSIPGTHDSGSIRGGKALKTQTTSIKEQLVQGVRAFDIRLKKHKKQLGIFHSHAYQGITWEKHVLPTFLQFLKEHPSEVLIVSLKKEGGSSEDYASLLSNSLSKPEHQSYFIQDFHPDLTLEECRGKILFLHRDYVMKNYPGASCSGWKDNCTCLLTLRSKKGKEGYVLLEDEYQYQSDKEHPIKTQSCINNLNNVSKESVQSSRWGITFISATGLPTGTPKVFADKVNISIANYLEKEQPHNCGILLIDFVNEKGGKKIVQYLINSNINQK